MDIFNSNNKLEELVMFGIDWGVFLRHNMDEPINPFIYLKNGNEQYVRMLMTDGDPLEYAKTILEMEKKPFEQFIIGFEGYLRDDENKRVDSIIVQGFDISQKTGVSLGQMFLPKENNGFKKIDKVTFLGNPDLILPFKQNDNPDYSVEEIGFNAIALSTENGLTKYIAIFTHDNPSIIANTIKQFLRSEFSSQDSDKLSGDFNLEITENCVKSIEFLTFVVKNAITEELAEEDYKNWSQKYDRKIAIEVKYNDEVIFETKRNKVIFETKTNDEETNLEETDFSSNLNLKKYLRILRSTKVYTEHKSSSKQIKILEPDTIISYNREKRRNKVNWIEIYIEEDKVAYIKKDNKDFYFCDDVKLRDESAQGFSISYKTGKKQRLKSIFFPKGTLTERDNIGLLKLESIKYAKKDKRISLEVEYDKNIVETNTFNLTEEEQFYVINNTYGKKNFIEIDNFKGKKGFILKGTNYKDKEYAWMGPVKYLTILIVVVGLIIAGWSLGEVWLVIGGLILIPAIIVAAIVLIIIQILKGIYNKIRKRF